jgi:predicted negative regulator of RcsB-dependent stress response
VLEQAAAAGDAQKVKAAAGELAEKFGGTTYASLGAMLAAKQSFDAGDLKTAKTQLSWVAENGKDEMRDLARLRLAPCSSTSRLTTMPQSNSKPPMRRPSTYVSWN